MDVCTRTPQRMSLESWWMAGWRAKSMRLCTRGLYISIHLPLMQQPQHWGSGTLCWRPNESWVIYHVESRSSGPVCTPSATPSPFLCPSARFSSCSVSVFCFYLFTPALFTFHFSCPIIPLSHFLPSSYRSALSLLHGSLPSLKAPFGLSSHLFLRCSSEMSSVTSPELFQFKIHKYSSNALKFTPPVTFSVQDALRANVWELGDDGCSIHDEKGVIVSPDWQLWSPAGSWLWHFQTRQGPLDGLGTLVWILIVKSMRI